MKLEDQVCSLELAKKLKELGVKQDGLFRWYRDSQEAHGHRPPIFYVSREEENSFDECMADAFTVVELVEMLPVEIEIGEKKDQKRFHIYLAKEYGDFSDEVQYFVEYQERKTNYGLEVQRCADTEADTCAKMLIYLLENKLISSPTPNTSIR